jgi:transposase-like protein
MPKKRYNTEDIIHKLREADVLLSQGMNVSQICKRIGIADQTYYRWRKVYGGMKVDQAKRLKELETENARLKRAVAVIARRPSSRVMLQPPQPFLR